MGKRGISPLIGAILIIAFTIAIAAVVMFWSAGFIKSTTETATIQTTKEVTCSMEVNLKINSACLEGNSLKYIIDNKGKQDLSGFIIRVYAADSVIANETNVTIPTLNVMLFRQYVDSSLLGSISKIEIVPVIAMPDGKKATCKDTVIDYKNIKTCTSESYLLYCKFDSSLTCENGETANSSGLSYTAKSIIDTSQSDFAQSVYYNLDIASESGNVLLSRPVADSNTVLLLHFDGNSTTDSSTYGNNGVLGGGDSTKAPQYTTSGRIGDAYTFDGTNDYINITSVSWPAIGTNDFSIETWIKPEGLDGNHRMIVLDQILDNFQFNLDDGGTAAASIDIYLAGVRSASSDLSWNLGQWYHITVTRNSGTVTFYRDGANVGGGTNNGNIATSVNLNIGMRAFTGTSHPFNGIIDEVRILNKALTPAEIRQDYQDQLAGKQLTVTDYEGIGNITSEIFDLGSNPTISSLSWNENKSWKYKKPITITNTEATPLTNHQVLITLTTSNFNYSRANADGSDIRFLKNSVQLNYWIESWNPAGESRLWVKVPYIAPSSSDAIYMYYNNPSAASESNGAGVFEFFDDFEDNYIDPSKWTQLSGTNWVEEDGLLKEMESRQTGDNVEPDIYYSNGFSWTDYILEGKIYADTSSYPGAFVRVKNPNTAQTTVWWHEWNTGSNTGTLRPVVDNTDYSWAYTWTGTTSTGTGVWRDFRVDVWGNNYKSYLNGVVVNDLQPVGATHRISNGTIGLGQHKGYPSPQKVYYDDIRVRKYVPTGPNVNVESEEVLSNITIQTRSGSSNASLGSWSSSYTNPTGEAWKSSNERYAQYLAFLETPTTFITPKLLDLTINYTEGSVSEGVSFENAVYNQGVYIEGADILNYPTTNNLNANEGTIELWVNMSWSDSSTHYILEDSNSVFGLYKSSSNLLVFDLFSIQSAYSVSSLSGFHHITIIWKANDKIYLYIDGIERDSDSIASIPTIGENLYLGSDSSSSNQLNGVIDELIISPTKKEFN